MLDSFYTVHILCKIKGLQMREKDGKFAKGNKLSVGNSGRPAYQNREFILKLIPNLKEWIEKEDSFVFNEWIANNGLHQQRCSEFCQECPEFEEAYKQAKLKVASRREKLASQGKLDAGIVKSTMFVYDREYFNHLVELKKASQESQQPQQINVVLQGRATTKRKASKKRKT